MEPNAFTGMPGPPQSGPTCSGNSRPHCLPMTSPNWTTLTHLSAHSVNTYLLDPYSVPATLWQGIQRWTKQAKTPTLGACMLMTGESPGLESVGRTTINQWTKQKNSRFKSNEIHFDTESWVEAYEVEFTSWRHRGAQALCSCAPSTATFDSPFGASVPRPPSPRSWTSHPSAGNCCFFP